jgi:phosphatidylglycerol:prolipoprotein diacylglycerol transferase
MSLATLSMPEFPTLHLGPVQIQSFGVLTALGVMAAVLLAARAARHMGKDPQVVMDFAVVGILAGVLVGHLVHVGLYHPDEGREALGLIGGCFTQLTGQACWDALGAFRFWLGLSSMGGLVGGILATVLWFRWKRIDFQEYADAFALGIAPGWGLARVGCFTVHDHPGVRTDFFLGVWMNGVPRHDLGLYEAILLFALAALLWSLHRRGLLRGRLLPLLAVLYGTGRFFLDFLRAGEGALNADGTKVYVDGRILGGTLTPAQVIVVGLVAYGVYRLSRPRAAAAQPGKVKAA